MTKVVAAKDQVSSFIGDEAVILNVKTGIYHGLNSVGARIWQLVETPITIDKIVETIVDEFDTDAATCEKDVLQLIEEMVDAELMDRTDEKL